MTDTPQQPSPLSKSIEDRIYQKWTAISGRVMHHLNLPLPLEPLDGMIILFRVVTDSIRVAATKMGPEAVTSCTEQFAQAETVVASFFDTEMSRVYAKAGTEPMEVIGEPGEVEGNPTYKVLGFEVAVTDIVTAMIFQYLAMNEQIPVARRIPNDRVALGLDLRHVPPHLYARAIEIEKALNKPPVGLADRIGACLMIVADSITSLVDELHPTNKKTVEVMHQPTTAFLRSMFTALTSAKKDPAAVLGFLAGVVKVAGDVAQQTMGVIHAQQAAGGVPQE